MPGSLTKACRVTVVAAAAAAPMNWPGKRAMIDDERRQLPFAFPTGEAALFVADTRAVAKMFCQ